MPKDSSKTSKNIKPNLKEKTATNVNIYQREVAEFSKYVKILDSFFHNVSNAEQMKEFNKFSLIFR
jgi:hypothetical protein